MDRISSKALALLVMLVAGAGEAHGQTLIFADGFERGDAWRWDAHTVFLIVMANKNWNEIVGSASAPYINSLLPQAAHALNYRSVATPAEPNYIWMEAGQSFGIANDLDPSVNHQSSTQHLVSRLVASGISWKSYQEGITGSVCPLTSSGTYKAAHDPMVFFDDVTDTNSTNSPNCIGHVRPYVEFAGDLGGSGGLARYNFITPDLCHDMHDACPTADRIANGDNWLASQVPQILASPAYQNGGVLFIVWDQGEVTGDCPAANCPIGLIALSTEVHASGYTNALTYDHSSLLLSLQELLTAGPPLGAAATATDLSDLFTSAF